MRRLYQLFVYLKNLQRGEQSPGMRGKLLYPTAQTAVDLRCRLAGHAVPIRTINVDQDWRGIHVDMLALIA